MKTLVAIGEALIDFAPQQTGRQIKDTESFMPKVEVHRPMYVEHMQNLVAKQLC